MSYAHTQTVAIDTTYIHTHHHSTLYMWPLKSHKIKCEAFKTYSISAEVQQGENAHILNFSNLTLFLLQIVISVEEFEWNVELKNV